MLKNYLMISAITALGCVTYSYAGQINIVNENNKELSIKIEAEGDSSATFKHNIPADRTSSFTITADQLNGKSHFTIKGDTSAFTSGDKCKHLSVDKDYTVSFTDDKMGTTCIAEEAAINKE